MHLQSFILSNLAMGLATFVALAPHFAAAKTVPVPPLKPSREEFREFCRYYREQGRKSKSTARIPRPKIGSGVAFVPVAAVEAGQNRFSFIRLTAALKKLAKLENLDNDKARNAGYIAAYDHGRSFFPKYRKTTGLYYRGESVYLGRTPPSLAEHIPRSGDHAHGNHCRLESLGP